MTLIDAVKKAITSSKKLRRKSFAKRVVGGKDAWLDITYRWADRYSLTSPVPVGEHEKIVQRNESYDLSIEDILADDWEVKP